MDRTAANMAPRVGNLAGSSNMPNGQSPLTISVYNIIYALKLKGLPNVGMPGGVLFAFKIR